MSDRGIVLLMGIIAGVLLCLVAGLLVMAAGLGSPAGADPQAQPGWTNPGPPAGAVIEAAVTEETINRAFMQSVPAGDGAWSLEEGRVDVLPDSRVQFTAQLGSPVGRLIVRGTIRIAVREEQLALRVTEVRLGQLPLTGLLRPFLPTLEAQVDDEANRQLSERAAQAKVRLVGVSSDETHLRFYLAGE